MSRHRAPDEPPQIDPVVIAALFFIFLAGVFIGRRNAR